MTEDSNSQKRKKSSDKKKSLRKKKRKGVQKNKLIDAPCESNIKKTVVEEHVSSENVYSPGR